MSLSVNPENNARIINLKPAIYDSNDNLVCILETPPGSTSSYSCVKIPQSVQPGSYKLKIAEQTGTDTYIPALYASTFTAEILTVTNEIASHELNVRGESVFTVSTTTLTSGSYFTASLAFGNVHGQFPFIGCYGLALTDENDEIKYVINQRCSNTLNPGYYYKTFNFYGYLPANLLPGNYRLRMVAKADGTDWSIVTDNGKGFIDYLDVTVPGTRALSTTNIEGADKNVEISIYPNPVKDILHINSPETEIKRITLIDLMGKVILTEDVNNIEKVISIQHFPQNTYILKIETSEGESIRKITKE